MSPLHPRRGDSGARMNEPATRADSAPEPVPVCVVGVGRMGRHHARIYAAMPDCRVVAVVDSDANRCGEMAQQYGCRAFSTVQEMLSAGVRPAAATVAAPTLYHRHIAAELFDAGIDAIIEKPLAPTTADCHAMIEHAQRCNRVLQVGHSERFNPVVRALSQYCLIPHFIEVQRVSPMTFRSIDIGVVLDMMIHDIDIVGHLVGAPVKSVAAVGVSVLSSFEDIANARLVFANGCVANLTASRLATKTERKMRLFSSDMYVSADYHKKAGVVIRRTANQEQLDHLKTKIRSGEVAELADLDYTELVNYEPLTIEDREPLQVELEAFISAVRHRTTPPVTGSDGLRAVDIAEKITASIAEHAWQTHLEKAPAQVR